MYFGIFGGGVPGITFIKDESAQLIRTTFEIKLNTDILSDERFLNLTPYEKLPRDIETGRGNPFLPY